MKSNLKLILLVFPLYLFSLFSFSQNTTTNLVTLIEKQNGKRLELYAKNTDTIPYVVFLRVTTNDYRRSSNRPVLKPVEPKSETHLLTLIKLAGSDGEYNHQFIVNEVSTNLKFRKDDDDMQINFDAALKNAQIVIYESNNCNFCKEVKTLFDENLIAYNQKHITNNRASLIKALKNNGKSITNLENETFIIEITNKIYRGITNKKELLEVLKNHIEK